MIYDVTRQISPEMAVWPGDPRVEREVLGSGGISISRWTLGSHTGTHVDAPAHFLPGGATLDALEPELLLGSCRVLHFPDASCITAELLNANELSGVTRLLLRTRNSRRQAEQPTVFDPTAVGVDIGAARRLLAQGVRLLGIDGLSVEAAGSDGGVHTLLLRAGVLLLEGLCLDAVPAGDYGLICAPLRLAGADGAPARVFLVEQVEK